MSSNVPPSGIITNPETGESLVPSSTRADGTVRKELRVRPGYKPEEDIERYRPPGARSSAQNLEVRDKPPPVNADNYPSDAKKYLATIANEKPKDLQVLRQPSDTGYIDTAYKSNNADPSKAKPGTASTSNNNVQKQDTIRNPQKSTKTSNKYPMATDTNPMQRDLPLRLKKPTKANTASESKGMRTTQSTTPQKAEQTNQESTVYRGKEEKPKPHIEQDLTKEAVPDKIPTLSEMRKMVQEMPTMASLGFWLPKSHRSRKVNTCHVSYYTLRRHKVTWNVVPAPEAEQWFDAPSTLEEE